MIRVFSKILILIIFFALVSGGIFAWQYQKISETTVKAEQLTKEKDYDKAIKELEYIQKKWIIEKLGVKKREIAQKLEENKQLLKNQINYENGVKKIKEKDWEGAKELFLNVSEKSFLYPNATNKIEVLEEILGCKYRKGEYRMKIFDSQGRITGIVDGEVKEEIPYSIYDSENNTVMILFPSDSYTYEFYAMKAGNYQFTLTSVIKGETMEFHLENIPISLGATHRIQVDEKAVEEEKKEAVLWIDANSDGKFEEKITFNKKLTCGEFIVQTKMPDIY